MLPPCVKQLAPFFNYLFIYLHLPYCLEKMLFVYVYKNRFPDVFPWPNFLSRSNMVNVFSSKSIVYFLPTIHKGADFDRVQAVFSYNG